MQLQQLKKKQQEKKQEPKSTITPVAQAPSVVIQAPEPQLVSDFSVQTNAIIPKIRKPNVEDVSAFDDLLSGPSFRQAEDPYEGKSMSEVLRMKREAMEKDLVKTVPA